jgi:phytase-like protein
VRRLVTILIFSTGLATTADAQTVVQPVLRTAPLFNYEDAPATPDADDPAIWINRRNEKKSLVIGAAKDAGLVVYDLSGTHLESTWPSCPTVAAIVRGSSRSIQATMTVRSSTSPRPMYPVCSRGVMAISTRLGCSSYRTEKRLSRRAQNRSTAWNSMVPRNSCTSTSGMH